MSARYIFIYALIVEELENVRMVVSVGLSHAWRINKQAARESESVLVASSDPAL